MVGASRARERVAGPLGLVGRAQAQRDVDALDREQLLHSHVQRDRVAGGAQLGGQAVEAAGGVVERAPGRVDEEPGPLVVGDVQGQPQERPHPPGDPGPEGPGKPELPLRGRGDVDRIDEGRPTREGLGEIAPQGTVVDEAHAHRGVGEEKPEVQGVAGEVIGLRRGEEVRGAEDSRVLGEVRPLLPVAPIEVQAPPQRQPVGDPDRPREGPQVDASVDAGVDVDGALRAGRRGQGDSPRVALDLRRELIQAPPPDLQGHRCPAQAERDGGAGELDVGGRARRGQGREGRGLVPRPEALEVPVAVARAVDQGELRLAQLGQPRRVPRGCGPVVRDGNEGVAHPRRPGAGPRPVQRDVLPGGVGRERGQGDGRQSPASHRPSARRSCSSLRSSSAVGRAEGSLLSRRNTSVSIPGDSA